MFFNLKKSFFYNTSRWLKTPLFAFSSKVKVVFLLGLIVFLAVFFFQVFFVDLDKGLPLNVLGQAIIIFCFYLIFWEISIFAEHLKNPDIRISLSKALESPDLYNWAGFLNIKAFELTSKAFRFARKNKNEKTQLKTILLYVLICSKTKQLDFVLQRLEISWKKLKKELEQELMKLQEEENKKFEEIILLSAKFAQESQVKMIDEGHLFVAFAFLDDFLQNYLLQNDLQKEDIKDLVFWWQKNKKEEEEKKVWHSKNNLLKKGSIGKDFTSGYTMLLDNFSFDWRERVAKSPFRQTVGHQQAVEECQRILERESHNHILLVGEPGVGRRSVVESLAQKFFLQKGTRKVRFKRMLQLDLGAVVAQAQSSEETEAMMEQIFSEALKAGNIILVIENLHDFVENSSSPGKVNISGILSRYLDFPNFQIIGISTFEAFHRVFERNSSFESFFEKVEVKEISPQETMILLQEWTAFFERKNRIFITYKALKEIVKLSSAYLAQKPFPEKALRLLDEAVAYLSAKKSRILRQADIAKIIQEKTKIPVSGLETDEKQKLLHLEDLIHKRLINQEEAVRQVASALRRARTKISSRSGPMGGFLFLGPTGVGKTETAKALAEIYFGSEERMVRFDMSEFQNREDTKRLIGSFEEDGLLTTKIKQNPFSLLLLDELEKADANILNLFLQVLDEGFLTDGLGRRISFQNTLIIATSNAGSEMIFQATEKGEKLDNLKSILFEKFLEQRIFKPEFLNRFDEIVIFKPLSKDNLLLIAGLQLNKLVKNLLDKGIKMEISKELKEKIVELSYKPSFGAREMKRVLQDKVENVLARAILSGEIKRGDKIKINPISFAIEKT